MTRPIRVLELRSVWGTGGGPDKTVLAGARATDRSRVAVTVCYIRDSRDRVFALDRQAAMLGLDYVEVVERHSFDVRIWAQLRGLVRQRKIDIVHAHDHKTDALTWALSKRETIVPLSTAHGFAGKSWNERTYYAIEKRLLAHFPKVIAVSQPIRAELVRTGSHPERVVVINNAIDPDAFRSDAATRESIRRSLDLSPSDVVIGAVGRLEQEKRFDLLIDVFAELHRTHPNTVLVIVGDGALRGDLEGRRAQTSLGPAIRLLGHRTDVAVLYNGFDVFVQSSEREGTPNCVLEAMAMETPIVATDVGGTSELVTNDAHALLVPRNDGAALGRALARAIDEPGRARSRAVAARDRVEADLSFRRRMERVEAVYDELMAMR